MKEQENKATVEILKISHTYWEWLIENNAGSSFSTFVDEFLESGYYKDYENGGMICKNLSVLYQRIKNIFSTLYEEDFSLIQPNKEREMIARLTSKSENFVCLNCGREFILEYSNGGSIEHNNVISNMKVFVSRWKGGSQSQENIFWSLINLSRDGHLNTIASNSYRDSVNIFKCALKWLKEKGPADLYEYMKSREGDIAVEYNRVLDERISEIKMEKTEEVKKLEEKRVRC